MGGGESKRRREDGEREKGEMISDERKRGKGKDR